MKMTPVFLVVLVFTVWVVSGFVLYEVENRGSFGDMFGAINSLFSGLAFAGVVYAILLQQKEVKLQKEELALTRKELEKTADAAKKQASHMESQRKREDLYRLISKLADRINNNFNSNFLDNGVSLHLVMKGSDNINDNEQLSMLYESCQYAGSNNSILIKYIEKDLNRLARLIRSYESETCGNSEYNPISGFYKEEFGDFVSCLFKYSLLKGDSLDLYMKNKKEAA